MSGCYHIPEIEIRTDTFHNPSVIHSIYLIETA